MNIAISLRVRAKVKFTQAQVGNGGLNPHFMMNVVNTALGFPNLPSVPAAQNLYNTLRLAGFPDRFFGGTPSPSEGGAFVITDTGTVPVKINNVRHRFGQSLILRSTGAVPMSLLGGSIFGDTPLYSTSPTGMSIYSNRDSDTYPVSPNANNYDVAPGDRSFYVPSGNSSSVLANTKAEVVLPEIWNSVNATPHSLVYDSSELKGSSSRNGFVTGFSRGFGAVTNPINSSRFSGMPLINSMPTTHKADGISVFSCEIDDTIVQDPSNDPIYVVLPVRDMNNYLHFEHVYSSGGPSPISLIGKTFGSLRNTAVPVGYLAININKLQSGTTFTNITGVSGLILNSPFSPFPANPGQDTAGNTAAIQTTLGCALGNDIFDTHMGSLM